MASRGSLCTLTRCASFEEDHLPTVCLQAATGGPPADAPPPPPQPPRGELAAYLQHLGAAGAVELPPNFDSLVAAEEADQRRAHAASRGWLAPAAPAAPAAVQQPNAAGSSHTTTTAATTTVSAPVPPAANARLLREALKKVQQLDAALQAAGQRAAAVAARGRELDQAMKEAGVADENGDAGDQEGRAAVGTAGCGLEGAMHRERRRLQQAERLRAALDGEVAEEEPSPFQGGSADVLTPEQEQLVDRLLDAAEDAAIAAAGAPQQCNPFFPEPAELAAIDARLAELAVGSGGQTNAATAAAAPAGCPAGPAAVLATAPLRAPSSGDDDLAALKAGYLRARADALEAAHRLTEIDAALASLRACDGGVAVR